MRNTPRYDTSVYWYITKGFLISEIYPFFYCEFVWISVILQITCDNIVKTILHVTRNDTAKLKLIRGQYSTRVTFLQVEWTRFYENETNSSVKRVIFLRSIMSGSHSTSKNDPRPLFYGDRYSDLHRGGFYINNAITISPN